jgi:transcriptional regulator with XRE-family HTH domain
MADHRSTPDALKYRKLLAERLRITRLLVEPKQAEAARKIGITQNAWFRYESGDRRMNLYALAMFCIAYDVHMDWLLLGSPEKLRQPLRDQLFTVPQARKYLRNLPPPAEPPASPHNRYAGEQERVRKALTDFG